MVLERQDTQIKDLQEELRRKEQYLQAQIEKKESDLQALLEKREKTWKQELAIKEKDRENARKELDKVMKKRDEAVRFTSYWRA